ncbi:uncharacterized protein LOC125679984 [Ostrea edulis]|uniref:uncharacterized protein LOC125679984 n=1 Tax=Ostrea edulis TaxID=37623 RepID=UPI0024AFE14A|nr:uncharacterized protein LOC125679984 [Ostrea edulis]
MEATTEEEYMEGIIQDKSMEKSIDDEIMEETIYDEIMEGIIHDESMEGTIHDEIMERTMKEEGGVETFQVKDTQRTAQYVEEENGEEENEDHSYIRIMRSPLVLEGFLLKNKDNTTNIRKESKDLINEAGTSSALLSDDKKQNSSKLFKLLSRFNPFTAKNTNGKENNHGRKAKKGRRPILLFCRLFGR